jgi:hypothetical protein
MPLHVVGPVVADPQLKALMVAKRADGKADIRI